MSELGKAYVQIVPSATGISEKIKEILGEEMPAAGEDAGTTIGNQIGSFAKKAIVALGVGKMISDSITDGMDFETSMAKTSTLFSGTSGELANLKNQIIDISNSTGVAASELAQAAYNAESASVPMGNLGGMIESSAKLATAGFTDIDTALSATAKTMNAYNMMSDDTAQTQANMEKVQRILIQTQNKGITSVGELGASLAQVTPTAASFGVSFEQVGASLAGMTAQGTPTAQATTQLNSLIAELGKNGTQASANLMAAAEGTKYAGMSFSEMMESGADLNDVLAMMQGYAEDNNVSLVDMFGSIEAGKGALSITNSDWTDNLEAMATDADVVGEAFGTMSDTAAFKLDQLKTTLSNIGISAFLAVADGFTGAIEGISGVIDRITPSLEGLGDAFLDLFGSVGNYIADLTGMSDGFSAVDAVAGALSGVIDTLTAAVQFLSDHSEILVPILSGVLAGFAAFKAITGVTKIITAVKAAIAGVGAVLAFITSPIGIAVIAIGVLVAAGVALYKNADKVAAFVKKAWEGLKAATAKIFNGIKTSIKGAMEAIKKTATSIAKSIGAGIKGAFSALKSSVASIWTSIKSKTASVWSGIRSSISGIVTGIRSKVTSVFSSLKSKVTSVWNGIKSAMTRPIETAKNTISGIISKIKGMFPLSIGKIFSNIKTPKITVDPGSAPFGIAGKGSLPHFHVRWEAKAMAAPYMFGSATLFGAGEAGDEILYGRENLMKDIRSAVGGSSGNTIYITNHIDGAKDPEAYASRLVRQLKLELRTV